MLGTLVADASSKPLVGGDVPESINVPLVIADVPLVGADVRSESGLVLVLEREGNATFRCEFKMPDELRDFAALEFLKEAM